MNDELLQSTNINELFSTSNYKNLIDNGIHFLSLKGQKLMPNQDSLFVLKDGDMKIIGVLDGHGIHGDKVSSFAASMLLNYIRNVKGSFFNSSTLVSSTHLEIETELKRCFKYV